MQLNTLDARFENFIQKSNIKHNWKYDYSKVNYVNTDTKVTIICPIHGCFDQTPHGHASGKGCKSCAPTIAKNTFIKKYGVENPSQNTEIKKKRTNTILKKYGVENAFQCEKAKNKIKQTNIKKYGVENPSQSNEIKEKKKSTCLKNYGVEYAQQNVEVRNMGNKTKLTKYGVEHITQTHMLEILHLINDKDWLFEQYVTHNKSTTQIASELNITPCTILNRLHKHNIDIKYYSPYSKKSIQWLELLTEEHTIFIQHAGNIGEYKIPGTKYKADGYCEETNTVYEFHGDAFHGNPELFKEYDLCHPYKNLTAKELYDETKRRENKIKELGFNLVVIWENDFNKQILSHL